MYTVLLVDDEPEPLLELESAANGEGRRVLKATTLQDALAIVDRENLDLVVTDLVLDTCRLDNRGGFAVMRSVLDKDPGVPVILISSYLTPDETHAAIDKGAFDVIDKSSSTSNPYELLRLKIRQALKLRQFQRVA